MNESELSAIKKSLEDIQRQLNRHETMLQSGTAKSSVSTPSTAKSFTGVMPTSAPAPLPKKDTDMERTIGTRWLAWVGFLSFIVGVSLFLKYAFEQGWITESGRLILGYAGGVLLAGLGELLRRKSLKYGSYANVIQGIGVVILYLVTFAAFNLYGLLEPMTAFGILIFITAGVTIWGITTSTPVLLGTGFFGAYLTPVLVHSGVNRGIVFFLYLALLTIAMMVVARIRGRSRLFIWGVLGTYFLLGYWAENFYFMRGTDIVLAQWLFIFTALFSLGRFVIFPVKTWKEKDAIDFLPVWTVPIATLLTLVLLSDLSVSRFTQGIMLGAYAVVQAVAGGFAVLLAGKFGTRAGRVFLAAAVYCAVLAVHYLLPATPIVQAAALGIEAVVIFSAGILLRREEFRVGGLTVFVFGMFELGSIPFPPAAQFELFLTAAFGIRLFLLLCLCAIAALYRRAYDLLPKEEQGMLAPAVFVFTHVAILWLISTEIGRWFGAQYQARASEMLGKDLRPLSRQIANQGNIVISIFWGLYGIGALLFGFLSKSSFVRVGGLILLIITILKVALHDFWSFGTLYRMIVSLSLGVVLLLGAFFYHRFQDRIKQFINE